MTVSQSRWGFHPTDFETFRKLKRLHRRYWETVYALARFIRWERKTVNRKGTAPRYCPCFVMEQGWWERYTNRDGYAAMRWHPKTLVDHGIRESYRTARMPAESPQTVKELPLSKEQIDRLYDEVEAWFQKEEHSRVQPVNG